MFGEYRNINSEQDYEDSQEEIRNTIFENWFNNNLYENIEQVTRTYLRRSQSYQSELDNNINSVISNYENLKCEDGGSTNPTLGAVMRLVQDKRREFLQKNFETEKTIW